MCIFQIMDLVQNLHTPHTHTQDDQSKQTQVSVIK